MKKDFKTAFCAVRPPGHHAEKQKAMGFCVYNNVAVGAYYLLEKYKLKKVAIIDFDVHHGNGTQEIFYNDETVAYGSSHEYPLFPGTGSEEEVGVGNIFNAPLKTGIKGKQFLDIFEKKILRPLDKFKPEVIIISASFVTTGSVSFSELFKLNLFLSNNISDNVIFESPIKLSKKFFSLSEIGCISIFDKKPRICMLSINIL